MKKICFFAEKIDASGGIPRVVSVIANGLTERNYQVSILSLTNENDGNGRYELREEIAVAYLFRGVSLNYRKDYQKIERKLKRFFQRNHYDDIIVAGMDFVPFFKGVRKLAQNTKMIAWEHSNFIIGKKFGMRWRGRRIACKKFDAVVVLTDQDLELYQKGIRKIRSGICRIYNPVYQGKLSSAYDKDSRILLSCGALIEQKGFDYALEVAALVFQKQPDWKWLIYGEGPERKKLETLISQKKLENHVFLKGYADNIDEIYQKSALFVLTSRYEGFCMVNLEAAQMGIPVVAFDFYCGPGEIIADGINGYLIENFDIREMAEKILYLIEHPQKRVRMSAECENSLEKFSLEKIMESWCSIVV